MRIAAAQIQGARKRQEDSFAVETCADGWLAVVADGLGGQPCGDVASQEAVRVFVESFKQQTAEPSTSPNDAMMNALLAAKERVVELEAEAYERLGMSTTLIAVYATTDSFWHLSVGDSLILLLHQNRLSLVNRPHTKDGYITSCVGSHMELVDFVEEPHPFGPGDRILLASDGILSMPLEETGRILHGAPDPQTAVEALLQAINNVANQWQDNVTLATLFPE